MLPTSPAIRHVQKEMVKDCKVLGYISKQTVSVYALWRYLFSLSPLF